MIDHPESAGDREAKIDAAVVEYLEAAEAGRPLTRKEFLARYPDLADDLARFLDDTDRFDRLWRSVRMNRSTTTYDPEQYRGYLWLLAYSLWDAQLRHWGDPDDVVNDTVFEAYRKLEALTFETEGKFKGWLRTILANNIRDAHRKVTRGKRDYKRNQSLEASLERSSVRLGMSLADDDPTPSEQASTREQLNRLADAMRRLPRDQLAAVVYHKIQGLSREETAAAMGKTTDAVTGLYRRAIKALKDMLGGGE